ncbi:phage terminase large subunit [Polynucleobacter sp. AP-RePozz3-80-G7]|uniref:phage terminase large subunit n=1 Tax=Polynucleobacter sp. AP-RePozz3-80-G7 TaxID=2689105 RepID=UPI001C0E4183|nr:phage terminase large subunit [Polynucleobacter sp. AP-RePozz3-80-G7]MBU3640007.1 phage terminase large subunit [Polynucleobacter sp. AP-RePozz3-80-G7]
MSAPSVNEIQPQPGPQTQFLATSADIAIYGGAAGGGKTWALLLEPLRHVVTNTEFAAVFFRRNTVQVRNPGGLWDESNKLYPLMYAKPVSHVLEWHWPKGGRVKFAHLEHENTKLDWQGAQIPLICFDELTHFSRSQFFYLLSRNRSMSGVKPYIRATCNPDADSWVAELIEWWIDQKSGLAIPERSGVVRWFIVINDKILWGDSAQELIEKYGSVDLPSDHEEQVHPKSLTFISAKLSDNKALLKSDPNYLANLKALPAVEQARLLGGNWKIRPAAGLYFRREWCEIVDAIPSGTRFVRYWDLAATPKTEGNDPDWTIGVKLGHNPVTGLYYVAHVVRLRDTSLKVENSIINMASSDTSACRIGLPQDPGQAGKSQASYLIGKLAGYTVTARPERGSKIIRFGPFSAQAQAGNVKILRGSWNEAFFTSLEGFPDANHDDDVDACGGAFGMFTNNTYGLFDYIQQQHEKMKVQQDGGSETNPN